MFAAKQEIPFHSLGDILIRLDSLGHNFAIKKKWQLKSQNARLSSAVVSTEQEPSVFIPEFLIVVPIYVEQSASERLPTLPSRHRKQSVAITE
jgi:hypothetical protein